MTKQVIVSKEQYERFKNGISTLLQGLGEAGVLTDKIQTGSIADNEAKRSADFSKQVSNAISIADLMIEYSYEHLSAFGKILAEPIEPFASLTCLRSMLESCALVYWLLDPSIEALVRVDRVFAYRINGLKEQTKLNKTQKQSSTEIEKRMSKLRHAVASRFEINNVSSHPGATDLISRCLKLEFEYRVLSGVNHGHSWALLQLGFSKGQNNPDTSMIAIEKEIKPEILLVFGLKSTLAFARSVWTKQLYCSVDSLFLEELLENVADLLQASIDLRFWRSD